MALRCGIVGIANVGKTTLFNCISNTKAESSQYAFTSNKSNIGMVNVPDDRLYTLSGMVKPAKTTPTTMEIIDIPGLTKGSSHGEGVGNQFLADIRNTDAIIHVLRCFDDDNLPHIDGSIDPVRDMETLDFELQVKDLESIDKKIEKVEKMVKGGEKQAKSDIDVLRQYKAHLENFQSVRTAPLDEKAKAVIHDLALLTAKPVMYVCNVDEESVQSGNAYVEQVKKALQGEGAGILVIAAGMEAEIAELEDPDDRKAFLEDAGLHEPGVNRLIRSAYSLLNLISFFTIGPKEVRAWTIKEGMTAPQAAGAIHSDLERGFIRAEVIKYKDFIEQGSEHACKTAGKMAIEGKNYIVSDGDLMYIRFNV